VNSYLLFIDTEATGLPKNWSQPYAAPGNWPHAVQVSWIIYDQQRNEIKREDHYIKNTDFEIEPAAIKIHGITPEYLAAHGEPRADVLQKLADDLHTYQPLVVGHFLKLDYYVLSADFLRAGIKSPLDNADVFCTMITSGRLAWQPMPRQMHLSELYATLFYKDLQNQHNALVDAEATAECFFELLSRGDINDKVINQQNADAKKWRDPRATAKGCVFPVLLFLLLGILVAYITYYERTL